MKYLSVCSGIEAATVAWHPFGWRPVAFSEIEKFPRAVLQHHYPEIPLHGDFTTIGRYEYGEYDILVGGTPCQSFSVAGLRQGLRDPRGNLMLSFLRLAELAHPRWILWENVPGVLSSNGGRDFGTFLGALAQLGYGFAYRILDAQYVRVDGFRRAVPQRRRRVFVVGYFGDWRRAAAVLFEPEGLRGDPAPRREAGKETTHSVAPCVGESGRGFTRVGDPRGQDAVIPVVGPLTAGFGSNKMGAPEVDANLYLAFAHQQGGKVGLHFANNTALTLQNHQQQSVLMPQYRVRRLTPLECERLQGFPDHYTRVLCNGNRAKDGPRYKALGNSMPVNCMRWIGWRIKMSERISQQSFSQDS